ncbi:hypothetical protein DRN69_00330 [Candidatus Pacearchaeota archaeon]|nr:MAG: hypothetical protein DRN69_00330 [Candidatus Pacearchaeota archaeon]
MDLLKIVGFSIYVFLLTKLFEKSHREIDVEKISLDEIEKAVIKDIKKGIIKQIFLIIGILAGIVILRMDFFELLASIPLNFLIFFISRKLKK